MSFNKQVKAWLEKQGAGPIDHDTDHFNHGEMSHLRGLLSHRYGVQSETVADLLQHPTLFPPALLAEINGEVVSETPKGPSVEEQLKAKQEAEDAANKAAKEKADAEAEAELQAAEEKRLAEEAAANAAAIEADHAAAAEKEAAQRLAAEQNEASEKASAESAATGENSQEPPVEKAPE
jgi:predicted nucleotidyltransferase